MARKDCATACAESLTAAWYREPCQGPSARLEESGLSRAGLGGCCATVERWERLVEGFGMGANFV